MAAPPLSSVPPPLGASHHRADACYTERRNRLAILPGRWHPRPERHHSYAGNLSCPFEFRQYSCRASGFGHAERAALVDFLPNACHLSRVSAVRLAAWLNGGRLLLLGDSLMRQVFIALACALAAEGAIESSHVPWRACVPAPSGGRACGEHSFATYLTIGLGGGGSVLHRDVAWFHERYEPSPGDCLVVQAGVHNETRAHPTRAAERLLEEMLALVQRERASSAPDGKNPMLIWAETPAQHFVSEDGAGVYDPELSTRHKGSPCVDAVPDTRSRAEWSLLRQHPALLDRLHGVLALSGTNELGAAKFGVGDCTHYCLPGPPDVIARALYTMLLSADRLPRTG